MKNLIKLTLLNAFIFLAFFTTSALAQVKHRDINTNLQLKLDSLRNQRDSIIRSHGVNPNNLTITVNVKFPDYNDSMDYLIIKFPGKVSPGSVKIKRYPDYVSFNGQRLPGINDFVDDMTDYNQAVYFFNNFTGNEIPTLYPDTPGKEFWVDVYGKGVIKSKGNLINRNTFIYFLNPATKKGFAIISYRDKGFLWGMFDLK